MSFLKVLGCFILGLILGAAIALGLCLAAQEIFNISQFEGAYAMAVVSLYMPVGAILGGLIGAVWMIVRLATRKPSAPAR
jgi:hypothetical protein